MFSRDQIVKLIREKVHHPATARELLRVLRIPREERASVRRQIRALTEEGELIRTRGGRVGLPDKMDLVVGRLETHRTGYGFVVPERAADPPTGDVYIAAPNLKEAMHGDRVVARIEHVRADRGAEGSIVRILERGTTRVVGRFSRDEAGLGFVTPFDERVLADVQIPDGFFGEAHSGDIVTAELVRWPTPTRGPIGHVVEVLGDIDAPGVDTEIIIRKFDIPDRHGEAAVEEARALARRKLTLGDRTDFRDRVTVTIDGEHARDFDDAVGVERLPNGNCLLSVHIADVSYYVADGSALDLEAYARGTSVYFPDRAVHMFPTEVATGVCSLNPGVDRLVQSCLMEVDGAGTVVRYEFLDAVIRTIERMTYTDVNAILTERDPLRIQRYAGLVPTFELMEELFHVLRARRQRRGSIDFDLPEPEVILDEAGLVEEILEAERNVAHMLIEEFMLLANETVAQYLEGRGVPSLYRVHEEPDVLKIGDFEEFVSGLGHSLAAPPGAVRPRHFQKLLDRIRGTPEEKPIAFLMLRTMQKARYAPQNLGHFGLAADCYTHFTSPIRRYPDLIVHRILREARRNEVSTERAEQLEDDLPELARHCSEMERRADEAERELVQWKTVRFMVDKVGDEFDGYITGVAPFGLFVQIIEHYVEGMVHVSSMADDYYRFLERGHAWRGENTHKVYRLGDRVRVQVVRVDLERRKIDLGLVDVLDAIRRQERDRSPRRSKARPRSRPRTAARSGDRKKTARRKR